MYKHVQNAKFHRETTNFTVCVEWDIAVNEKQLGNKKLVHF